MKDKLMNYKYQKGFIYLNNKYVQIKIFPCIH